MAAGTSEDARWEEHYGPWALVTGASDGIGRAMALEAAERGLDLVLVARRQERLEALVSEIERRYGRKTKVMPTDLADRSAVATLMDAVAGLDIGLVAACAGFGTSGRFLDADPAGELGMLEVNCASVLVMTQVFAKRLAERGRGGIVLMSSLVAYQGVPHAAHYAATKAYIQVLAEGLRAELRASGVDVLASAPGPVASGFANRADMKMGRAEKPETVARQTLEALGRQTTVWPGPLSKLLIGSLATLPRFARIAIMGAIMGGMTRHQSNDT